MDKDFEGINPKDTIVGYYNQAGDWVNGEPESDERLKATKQEEAAPLINPKETVMLHVDPVTGAIEDMTSPDYQPDTSLPEHKDPLKDSLIIEADGTGYGAAAPDDSQSNDGSK